MRHALQALGISADAANVYLTLVAEPSASLADLAGRSGLHNDEVSEAIVQLTRLGLIESVRPGHVTGSGVRLADPDYAFSASLRRREAELAREEQELAEAKVAIAVAAATYQGSAGHSERCARPIASQQEALDMARRLIAGAVGECLIAFPDLVGTFGEAGAQLAGLASHGARVAIICADAARSSPARTHLDWLERSGAQVRTLPAVTVPLIAGTHPPMALLWPGTQEPSTSTVLARDPVVARTIAGIFESYWDVAIPLEKALPPDPKTGLTPADQALLTMLAAGLSGETAARRLGTSLTTVRRQIAHLKEALDAESLFQAGCLAAKRGWV